MQDHFISPVRYIFVPVRLILFLFCWKLAAGAGLTGTKMARRFGSVDEFEFKAIGENQNQGVSCALTLWLCVHIVAEVLMSSHEVSSVYFSCYPHLPMLK